MAKINEGDVAIHLNGEEIVLRPTLRAMTGVASNGGLLKVKQALVDHDFNTIVSVILHGANLVGGSAGKQVPDAVYRNGISTELLVGLINYVNILGNGGKPLPEDVAASAAEEPAEGNPS